MRSKRSRQWRRRKEESYIAGCVADALTGYSWRFKMRPLEIPIVVGKVELTVHPTATVDFNVIETRLLNEYSDGYLDGLDAAEES